MTRWLAILFLLLSSSVAHGAAMYATLSGTVLDNDGSPCVSCNVTIRTAVTQVVGGETFPEESFGVTHVTDADGDLPTGVFVARTLIVGISLANDPNEVRVRIPDQASVNISDLILPPVAPPVGCTGCIVSANIATGAVTASKIGATDAPADEECLTYESTGPTLEWQTCGSGGGSSNSFETWDTPAGTDIVADSATDTVQFLASGIVSITGGGAADTITIGATEVGDIAAVGDCTSGACFDGTTGNSLQFEGSTADGFETTLTATDPTADRTATLPNFSGTVAIERVFDVRAYGALCNDSADDTAEIQAAIDAAEATGKGGVVELPVGICIVTGLNINEPGITLRGQGAGVSNNATVLSCNLTTGTCVTLDSACTYGCGLESMVVSARGSVTSLTLIDGTNASNDFVRNVTSSSQQYCVAIKNVGLIQDVSLFTPVAGASCRAISIVDDAVFMERAKVNFSTNIEGAIVIEQTVAGQVDTVVLSDVEVAQSGGAGAGLKIMGTSAVNPPRWIQVSNSLFEAKTTGATTGDYAIWLSNVRDFKCSSCYAQGGYNAVRVSGGPGPITFAASVIGNSMREALYHDADVVTTLVGTTVSDGGTETDNTYSDIYLSANSRGFTMIGGAVGAELLGFPGNDPKYGIEVDASASEYRFSDVNCSDVPDSGCASGLTPAATQAAFTDGTAYADSDWSNYVLVRAPSLAGNWTLTLPADDGNSGQFLQTNGSGVTTWATPSGSGNVSNTGTPVNNQVAVWTDATTIEGDAALTFDTTTDTLATTTFSGALSGNATTATALASNPSDCASDTYATTIAASGNLTCASITNASTTGTAVNTPSTLVLRDGSGNFAAGTITAALTGNASTATALAANPADCGADTYATTIAASGALTCATVTNAGLAGSIAMSKTLLTADAGVALSTNSLTTASAEGSFITGTGTLPGTCSEGAMYQDTDSGGTELYICTASNTWTKTIAATDNVATATALAANPSDCGSDTYATTIAANGNLTCSTVSSAGIANGAIVNDDINASAAIDLSKTALSAGTGIGLSGNTLSLATGEVDGPIIWGSGAGTMAWWFNAGATDPIIDFYGDGSVDVTGTLKVNTVAVLTDGTGTVDATNLATDSVSADELNATGVEAELEAVLDLQDLQGAVTDAQVPDTITASNYLPLAGGTMSGGILLNSSVSGSTASAFDLLDFSNTFTMTGGQTINGIDFSPTATMSTTTANQLNAVNWGGSVSISAQVPFVQGLNFAPTIDYSNTTDPFAVYRVSATVCQPTFTSSTANATLYQDCFADLSTVNYSGAADMNDTSTATGNPWAPWSLLSAQDFWTSGAGDLTIARGGNARFQPEFDAGNASSTLTFTNLVAYDAITPQCQSDNCGPGSVAVTNWTHSWADFSTALDSGMSGITNAYGLRLTDFDKATNNYSLYSNATTASMRHAGAVVVGSVSAPDSGYEFDLTGDADLNGDVRVGASTGTVNADDSLVTFPLNHDFEGIAADMMLVQANPTVHIGQASGLLGTYAAVSSQGMVVAHDDATNTSLPATFLFRDAMSVQRTVTSSAALNAYSFVDSSTLTSSGGVTVSGSEHFAVFGGPTFSSTGATSHTASGFSGFYWGPTVSTDNAGGAATVTTMKGVDIRDATRSGAGTETITTQIGVDIAALDDGATNIGIRNADTTVYTPGSAQTLNVVGSSITPSATMIMVTASGATGTLTSNPQVADGVDGQIIHIAYTNGATGSFTFADGNGLRLSGTMLMDDSNTLTLMYSSTIGDWVEIARSLN